MEANELKINTLVEEKIELEVDLLDSYTDQLRAHLVEVPIVDKSKLVTDLANVVDCANYLNHLIRYRYAKMEL